MTQGTHAQERTDDHQTEDGGRLDRAGAVAGTLVQHGRNGGATMLVGAGLLVRALRGSASGTRRRAATALAGVGLLGLGVRQRRARETPEAESDDASAVESVRRQVRTRVGIDDADGTETGAEGADEDERTAHEEAIEFTDEGDEPRAKPELDRSPTDPRREGGDDEGVEIDISDAAMADEASEATGPSAEQAQPTRTADPEPESEPGDDEPAPTRSEPPTGDAAEGSTEDADESFEFGEGEEAADETADETAVEEDQTATDEGRAGDAGGDEGYEDDPGGTTADAEDRVTGVLDDDLEEELKDVANEVDEDYEDASQGQLGDEPDPSEAGSDEEGREQSERDPEERDAETRDADDHDADERDSEAHDADERDSETHDADERDAETRDQTSRGAEESDTDEDEE